MGFFKHISQIVKSLWYFGGLLSPVSLTRPTECLIAHCFIGTWRPAPNGGPDQPYLYHLAPKCPRCGTNKEDLMCWTASPDFQFTCRPSAAQLHMRETFMPCARKIISSSNFIWAEQIFVYSASERDRPPCCTPANHGDISLNYLI